VLLLKPSAFWVLIGSRCSYNWCCLLLSLDYGVLAISSVISQMSQDFMNEPNISLQYIIVRKCFCQLHGQWNTVFFPTPSLSYKSTIVNFGCSTVSLSQSTVGEWVTIILIVWSYFMFYFHTCNIFCRRNACSLQIDDASSIVIMKVDMEMMFYIRVVFCNWAFFCVCV